jgi:cell division protein FtsL
MKQTLTLILLIGLAACASYDTRQHTELLRTAAQDDQTCLSQGTRFPEDRYVSCRLQLQDDRLHKDWLNLQLMRQTQVQPNQVPAPYSPREYYRPLDPDHFVCLLTTEADKRDYILCDETDEPQKS